MVEKDIDAILFNSLKSGNNDAFEFLFKKYYSHLCNYVQSFVFDSALSEDIVTDLFTDIWLKRTKIEIKSNFQAYLLKSARNSALVYLRKRKIKVKSIEELSKTDVHIAQIPDTIFEEEQSSVNIQNILGKIPPRSREVFVLHKFGEMKYKDIAKLLDISIKTVENNMSTALRKLHENKDMLRKL
jgi:RNA polymerase sigma-70 factor (ECF subfamily)